MASFETVNYSLRPSKSIQRQIVFEGIRELKERTGLTDMVYVGFGSIWFTDYIMAHKILNIRDMISIEADKIGYRRAVFNAPFASVRVRRGHSSAVLPSLYRNNRLMNRPWVVWLDFDKELAESLVADIQLAIENVPEDSVVLITFNGKDGKYGHAKDRPGRLRELLGDVVPDNLGREACKEEEMQETLAELVSNFMTAIAAPARGGRYISAFRAIYEDTAPMVTVGGVIVSERSEPLVADVVNAPAWRCCPIKRITAPHLTMREAATLQSALPRTGGLSRQLVRSMNFDLEDDQIESFEKYYKEYPTFAQIVG